VVDNLRKKGEDVIEGGDRRPNKKVSTLAFAEKNRLRKTSRSQFQYKKCRKMFTKGKGMAMDINSPQKKIPNSKEEGRCAVDLQFN